jgi:putative neutral zinc metallopeptidase
MLRSAASKAMWEGKLTKNIVARAVILALVLGAALLLLTACGGDTGSGSDVGSGSDLESANIVKLDPSAPASASPDSTTEESTRPISAACQPPDMEGCYDYEDMLAYLDEIIPMIAQFFDAAYEPDIPHPTEYIYVPEGVTGSTGCDADYTDEIYAYCPAAETIYTGQRALWDMYSDLGDAAPAVGLAHEWGHHVQTVADVPPAQTSVGQISRENQADCIAGAWVDYAEEQGWMNYPDDLRDIEALLEEIAHDERGREHGDLGERLDSLQLGIDAGLQGCNDFFPDSPVIVVEETTTAGPTATSTGTATATGTATSTTSGGDRVIP